MASTTAFAAGFDDGYACALRLDQTPPRMMPPEYFWSYEFRFDLRDATRGEQEAVRVLFLAQRLELDGFTERHVQLVDLVLGRASVARHYAERGDFPYDEDAAMA